MEINKESNKQGLYLPLTLSPEEALKRVKAYFGIGKKPDLSEELKKWKNLRDMTGKDGITAFQIGGCPPSKRNKPEEK